MSEAAQKRVQELIDANDVFVFSKSYCPYCKATKRTLEAAGVNLEGKVIELDKDENGADLQDALEKINGQRSVPNIYIGKKHIGGNSDLEARKQDLPTLLRQAGAIE